jgi:hypothetical protein
MVDNPLSVGSGHKAQTSWQGHHAFVTLGPSRSLQPRKAPFFRAARPPAVPDPQRRTATVRGPLSSKDHPPAAETAVYFAGFADPSTPARTTRPRAPRLPRAMIVLDTDVIRRSTTSSPPSRAKSFPSTLPRPVSMPTWSPAAKGWAIRSTGSMPRSPPLAVPRRQHSPRNTEESVAGNEARRANHACATTPAATRRPVSRTGRGR